MSLIGDLAAPFALITSRTRMIGTLMPDVVVEEIHNDQLAITKHPVEMGAAISDHSFRMPSTIIMKIGYSNSTGQSEGYVQEAYNAILDLQSSREPFDVFAGKRAYQNMLISSVMVTTDQATEYALNAVIGLEEVIITQTQETAAGATPTDQGTKQGQEGGPGLPSYGKMTGLRAASRSLPNFAL